MSHKPEIEIKITALLLGELPPDEAADLQMVIDQDPELVKLQQRLQATIELVKETSVESTAQPAPVPMRLSEKRREALLREFKTVRPKEFQTPKAPQKNWYLSTAVAVAIVALLMAISVPNFVRSRTTSQQNAMINDLRLLDGAKQQWALENKKVGSDVPTDSDLRPYLGRGTGTLPEGPNGEKYIYGRVDQAPSIEGTEEQVRYLKGEPQKKSFFARSSDKRARVSLGELVGEPPQSFATVSAEAPAAIMSPPVPPAIEPSSTPQPAAGNTAIVLPGESDKTVSVSGQATFNSGNPTGQPVAADQLDGLNTAAVHNGGGSGGGGGVLPQPSLPVVALNGQSKLADSSDEKKIPIHYALASDISAALAQLSASNRSETKTFDQSATLRGFYDDQVTTTTAQKKPAFTYDSQADDPDLTFKSAPFRPENPPTAGNTNIYNLDAVGYALVTTNGVNIQNSFDDAAPAGISGQGETAAAVMEKLKARTEEARQAALAAGEAVTREESRLVRPSSSASRETLTSPKQSENRYGLIESDAKKEVAVRKSAKHRALGTTIIAGKSANIETPVASGGTTAPISDNDNLLTSGLRLPKKSPPAPVVVASPAPAAANKENDQFQLAQNQRSLADESKDRGVHKREKEEFKASIQAAQVEARPEIQTRIFKVDSEQLVAELTKEFKNTPKAGENHTKDPSQSSVVATTAGGPSGLNFVTRTNDTQLNNEMVRRYLTATGVTLNDSDKLVFFNDRNGDLMVRASAEDLSKVEQALKPFAPAPPKVVEDAPLAKTVQPASIPQPEIQTRENAFSTFALNVSDVSYKLAAASLEKGAMPDAASIRSEEFINAFDYRDPEPPAGVPVAFATERARYPFAHNRDLLRFSIKTAALGRQQNRPLNLVLLLDNSGSMERADRQGIIRAALKVLGAQLHPQDTISVVAFSRTARLIVDGESGDHAGAVAEKVSGLTPQGGTNLEGAMDLAYQTAVRHYLANGINRVVLLTDGAANLGNVDAAALQKKVEAHRQQGVALDCFGIGWEGYNDDLLEVLSRHGDGRYAFLNSTEDASTEFVAKLAGALQVAAADVKVQIEFNTNRVTAYRQIGYAKHQLTKQQFRDNKVDAAEIGAAEAGNALYIIEQNPNGTGPIATIRVRFKVPATGEFQEHEWTVPCGGESTALEQATPALRLAATASAFSEWLAQSPYAGEVTPDRLLEILQRVPEFYGADARPKQLEWMIHQAKTISGK